MALSPVQFTDEAIHRQIKVTRYINGQVKNAQTLLKELNIRIAKHILQNDIIETKSQYTENKVYIRKRCIEYRDRFYKYLQNELRLFAKEQAKWVYSNAPGNLEKTDIDKSIRNIFFEAFSETENIKTLL